MKTLKFLISIVFLLFFIVVFGNRAFSQEVIHISTKKNVYNVYSKFIFSQDFSSYQDQGYLDKKEVYIPVKRIMQMPSLPRGCEVVALTMLLNHAGVDVTKEEIVSKVRKNPMEYCNIDGQIYFGSPANGFVGDIYTFENPGLGVYHRPIYEAARYYLGDNAMDMTGDYFDDIMSHMDMGYPVWVIVNAKYKMLPEDMWEMWITEDGKTKITRWMHSVLLTGYDRDYIYFNDPLGKVEKADRIDFIEAWEQMGRQAISYMN